MKAGIKADQELDNVKRQIAQLESVAGSNQRGAEAAQGSTAPGRGTPQAGERKL